MEVHKKECNRYIKMQEGGLPVLRGKSRYKRGGGGMFGMLAKSARSILTRVGKKYSNVYLLFCWMKGKTVNKKKEC